MESASWRIWLTAAVLMTVAVFTVPRLWNGPDRAAAMNAERSMVYVCSETGAVYTGIPQATPAVNPATNAKTLMPGWYCPRCQKWYAGPTVDVVQRSRRSPICEVCRLPLQLDGPPPAGAVQLATAD